MLSKEDISPGSLVRFNAAFREHYPRTCPFYKTRAQGVGVLIGFDLWGRMNPDHGDPVVWWAGENKPERMAGYLEIVS